MSEPFVIICPSEDADIEVVSVLLTMFDTAIVEVVDVVALPETSVIVVDDMVDDDVLRVVVDMVDDVELPVVFVITVDIGFVILSVGDVVVVVEFIIV